MLGVMNFPGKVEHILLLAVFIPVAWTGILYPKDSESREVKSLDGIWKFRVDGENGDAENGFKESWYNNPLDQWGSVEVDLMPVPSSYNDVSEKKCLRDHIGWVWYEREFWTPSRWLEKERNVFIRFGSVNYKAVVWINGEHVMNHTGGHLPFSGDITELLHYGKSNLLVVAVNNTLNQNTIPQGTLHQPTDPKRYPKGFTSQTYNFDYFHYSGIHRSVFIYTTPKVYIDDISIRTLSISGIIQYSVHYSHQKGTLNSIQGEDEEKNVSCTVVIRNKGGEKVASSKTCAGIITIPEVQLWWPYLSGPPTQDTAYLYTFEIFLTFNSHGKDEDVYRMDFGVRTVESTNDSFLINGAPFYFRGFGRHEDYNIRGRGLDMVHILKDHNLIRWTGANSYRTSHYPYAEEAMDLTDRMGIVIIDESPAIGLSGFGEELLANHLKVMKELVTRDKNRPSVVMWSIGNEPKSLEKSSLPYFESVTAATRELDPQQRPITIVLSEGFPNDSGPAGMDVVSINRYFAWYGDTGRTEVIPLQIPTEIHSWYTKYKKPVLMTEYGAGSIAGMHMNPSFVWTEDFQVDYHLTHFKAFDTVRKSRLGFIGEMIWNFADFATPPETFRPWGCMKGIFTRDRQPKRVANFVRWRYWILANETKGFSLPSDLHFIHSFLT